MVVWLLGASGPLTARGWAGRGLKLRWLAAAIKSGRKLEDFATATRKADVA